MNTEYRERDFAQVLGISKQRVSSLVKDGKLKGLKLGRDMILDMRHPVNLAWLAKRKNLPEAMARKVEQLRQTEDIEQGDGETDEAVYERSVVKECIKEAWEKCLNYAGEMTLPVSCEQLASAVLKARTVKKGAAVIRKSIERDLKDIEGYVDHAIVFILDGEEAAACWNEEHFDEDGNPRETSKDKSGGRERNA